MSFQAGVFYLDRRPVPGQECAAIVRGLGPNSTLPGNPHHRDGGFQAHVAVHLNVREANVDQPVVAEGLSITFDGRLDNREDLLLSMQDGLHRETCDVLLALAAYQRKGPDGFRDLIGDWSLAIWDQTRDFIVLASDYAGVRPLYYCVQNERV